MRIGFLFFVLTRPVCKYIMIPSEGEGKARYENTAKTTTGNARNQEVDDEIRRPLGVRALPIRRSVRQALQDRRADRGRDRVGAAGGAPHPTGDRRRGAYRLHRGRTTAKSQSCKRALEPRSQSVGTALRPGDAPELAGPNYCAGFGERR